MTKLKPTIAILTATLVLSGCGQQYETVGECKLAELKNFDRADEGAAEIVAEYCLDYFAKIEEEEERREAEQDARSATVQLVMEPEWVDAQPENTLDGFNSDEFYRVDIRSIRSKRENLRSAFFLIPNNDGNYYKNFGTFDCHNQSIYELYHVTGSPEDESIGELTSRPRYNNSKIIPQTSMSALYNFICSYEIR